ncbi:hypothetical protein DMC14_001450 [Metamycoplasma phocicerebrale]|uniref:Uncharacterized protein n=1 Tax=Metamycoplasma phocicerebrale TaxID=142649 RepID=A0A3Q9V950_9BACT|nr:hypothetical protein [Metamycoplasma phocicerebrale]AZZ65452.1 hypothetical protein DMC14_001450 [Metamycoplasma phocicerebrale]
MTPNDKKINNFNVKKPKAKKAGIILGSMLGTIAVLGAAGTAIYFGLKHKNKAQKSNKTDSNIKDANDSKAKTITEINKRILILNEVIDKTKNSKDDLNKLDEKLSSLENKTKEIEKEYEKDNNEENKKDTNINSSLENLKNKIDESKKTIEDLKNIKNLNLINKSIEEINNKNQDVLNNQNKVENLTDKTRILINEINNQKNNLKSFEKITEDSKQEIKDKVLELQNLVNEINTNSIPSYIQKIQDAIEELINDMKLKADELNKNPDDIEYLKNTLPNLDSSISNATDLYEKLALDKNSFLKPILDNFKLKIDEYNEISKEAHKKLNEAELRRQKNVINALNEANKKIKSAIDETYTNNSIDPTEAKKNIEKFEPIIQKIQDVYNQNNIDVNQKAPIQEHLDQLNTNLNRSKERLSELKARAKEEYNRIFQSYIQKIRQIDSSTPPVVGQWMIRHQTEAYKIFNKDPNNFNFLQEAIDYLEPKIKLLNLNRGKMINIYASYKNNLNKGENDTTIKKYLDIQKTYLDKLKEIEGNIDYFASDLDDSTIISQMTDLYSQSILRANVAEQALENVVIEYPSNKTFLNTFKNEIKGKLNGTYTLPVEISYFEVSKQSDKFVILIVLKVDGVALNHNSISKTITSSQFAS